LHSSESAPIIKLAFNGGFISSAVYSITCIFPSPEIQVKADFHREVKGE